MTNIVKYIETIDSKLASIPINIGNIIYVKDTADTYFDSSDMRRIKLGDIIQIATEEDRRSIIAPLENKLYLVIDTSKMYLYHDSMWVAINAENNTTTCNILAANWTYYQDEDGTNLYKVTLNHNMDTRNINTSIYNTDGDNETMGVKILDNNSILLINIEAIDCVAIIK